MRFSRLLLITASILGWALAQGVAPLQSAEISAIHLVYEKPRKMKKADTTLFMPFADQALKSDPPSRPREVLCSVVATGGKGALPVRGTVALQLLGSSRTGSGSWESDVVRSQLENGAVGFAASEIDALVSQATAVEASIHLFRIDFDGGRGKKIRKLTLDCLQQGSTW